MDLRSMVALPEGFRWLEAADTRQPFSADDKFVDRYSLPDYFEWGLPPGCASIARTTEGRVAAVVCFSLEGDTLFIEMLARNKLLPYPGTGAQLVKLLESSVAPALNVRELRLEARPGVVRFYDDDLGFEEYDSEVRDRDWPEKLTPKRKRL